MSNIDKRKLNRHIRIVEELNTEVKSMERSLFANGLEYEGDTYSKVSGDLGRILLRLRNLK